jgi:hypothetical protein
VRVSTRSFNNSGIDANVVRSTTRGVLLRKESTRYVFVNNHGFLEESEVFHPEYDGDKIGDIVDRYPESDIAMVRLAAANSSRFFNSTYFQAEPPKRLATRGDLVQDAWFGADEMSTGIFPSYT